jgi:hypothetical protein
LYSSPDIIRQIKSRRIKWVGHMECTGERNVYRVLVGKLKEKNHLKAQGVDGIKMGPREIGWGVWSGFTWLRIEIVGGLL